MTQAAPVVHVVDDDSSVRTAVTRLLRAAGFEARGYASAGDFLLSPRDGEAGCVILDLRMPGPGGLELQQALAKEEAPLPIVFLTGHGDIATGVSAIKSGAVDFLTKPVKREALLAAVHAALGRDSKERADREKLRDLRSRYEKLTGREREVLALVTRGRLNKQIAAELGTSERTIKAHRAQVMSKMEVASVAELVRVADRIGPAISAS